MKSLKTLMAAAGFAMAAPHALAIEIIVPAYFYPSWNPAVSEWTQLNDAAAKGAQITVIMNPGNGPGASFNSDYANGINKLRAAGGKVLGYDYTCYGINLCTPEVPQIRTTGDVLSDAQKYANWYNIDGVFLDEMGTQPSAQPFYKTVSDGLKAAHPTWQIVGNPGAVPTAGYAGLTTSVIAFENTFEAFVSGTFLSSLTNPAATGAIVHSVATVAQMQQVMTLAKQYGLGSIYVTDRTLAENPYVHLPTYWAAEVAAAAVPEPASIAMTLAGLAVVAGTVRRRRTS